MKIKDTWEGYDFSDRISLEPIEIIDENDVKRIAKEVKCPSGETSNSNVSLIPGDNIGITSAESANNTTVYTIYSTASGSDLPIYKGIDASGHTVSGAVVIGSDSNKSLGLYSLSEGGISEEPNEEGGITLMEMNTSAIGMSSHAEGEYTTSLGDFSHAEGMNTSAIGMYSHAEGSNTIALGYNSHAGGEFVSAIGETSFANGKNVTSNNSYETSFGVSNISLKSDVTSSSTLFSVGCGTVNDSLPTYLNALEIKRNGDTYLNVNVHPKDVVTVSRHTIELNKVIQALIDVGTLVL